MGVVRVVLGADSLVLAGRWEDLGEGRLGTWRWDGSQKGVGMDLGRRLTMLGMGEGWRKGEMS